MESKLEANSYETLDQFIYDAKLIFKNCRQYNDGGSNCASPLSESSSLSGSRLVPERPTDSLRRCRARRRQERQQARELPRLAGQGLHRLIRRRCLVPVSFLWCFCTCCYSTRFPGSRRRSGERGKRQRESREWLRRAAYARSALFARCSLCSRRCEPSGS